MSLRVINTTVNGSDLEIVYMTDDLSVDLALEQLYQKRQVGYDVETYPKPEYKLDPQGGLDPYRSELRLAQFGMEDGTIYIIDNMFIGDESREKIRRFLEAPYPIKVGHNIKFDIKFARNKLKVRRFGGLFCTELATRLVKCGTTFGRVRLLDAVKEFLGVKVEKEEQRSDWSNPELTDSQLVYAGYDAYIVLLLRRKLMEFIKELELVRVTKLEFDALDPVAWQELNGLGFNEAGWVEAYDVTQKKKIGNQEKIAAILAPVIPQQSLFEFAPSPVKLSSQQQMVAVLNAFGIDLPEMSEPRGAAAKKRKKVKVAKEQEDLFDYGGTGFVEDNTWQQVVRAPRDAVRDLPDAIKQTTRNWQIKPLKERYEVIGLLLDWREYQKRTTSYGPKYLKYVNPITNRIHSDYDPLRAKTGRWANSKPNLQQIPRDDDYRNCFIPKKGYKFVGADYSQIELRIAAEIFNEQLMIDGFKAGIDPHDNTTNQMFHLDFPPDKKKDREAYDAFMKSEAGKKWGTFRVFAKNINFGIPYGMGKNTLATRTGLTPEEAEQHLKTYSSTYKNLIRGLNAAAATVRETGEIRTLSGRIARFPFNPNDKEDVARAERNGKNTPIQGGNADIMKRAVRILFDLIWDAGLYEHVGMVHIVHDEIICEAKDEYAEQTARILETAMKTAAEEFLKIVPVEVEANITELWAK